MRRNRIHGNYTYENAKKAIRAIAKKNGHKLQNFKYGHDEVYCELCKKCARVGGENISISQPCSKGLTRF